jgi:hypothetical protein
MPLRLVAQVLPPVISEVRQFKRAPVDLVPLLREVFSSFFLNFVTQLLEPLGLRFEIGRPASESSLNLIQ